jgi:hypothetical protein
MLSGHLQGKVSQVSGHGGLAGAEVRAGKGPKGAEVRAGRGPKGADQPLMSLTLQHTSQLPCPVRADCSSELPLLPRQPCLCKAGSSDGQSAHTAARVQAEVPGSHSSSHGMPCCMRSSAQACSAACRSVRILAEGDHLHPLLRQHCMLALTSTCSTGPPQDGLLEAADWASRVLSAAWLA